MPPSTRNVLAVMNEESSEARNSTALAISSGSPKRPIGTCTSRRAARSGSLANRSRSSGVLTGPGAQRVDPDALAGELHAQLAGHREHPALGGRVGDLRGRRAHHRHERGGVDDRPTTLLQHVGERGLAAQVDAGEVDLLHPAPGVEVGVEDRVVVGRADPGVVERDVDRAVGVLGGPEQRVDLLLVGDVDVGVGPRVAVLGRERRAAGVVDVADDHPGALGDEALDGGQADAGAPAGDHRDAVLDAARACAGGGLAHGVLPSLMKTFFSSVKAAGASGPSSRPRPDCL